MAIRPGAIVANVRRLFLVVGVSALCGVLFAGLALPVVAGLGIGAREGADAFAAMPAELDAKPLAQRSRVVDRAGRVLATFYDENRINVGLDKIAPVMQDAILAIEDDRFFDRGPLDLQGTLRALLQNAQSGETQGGGSTLTQQYVKLVRLSQATTPEEEQAVLASSGVEGYKRKLEELRMAVAVEQELTKDEILERYLNIAYFGAGAHGIEAAARTYFSTTAAELTLTQAATLAGLVQSPTQYDPTKNPEAAVNRRNTVLSRMADTKRVSEAEAAEARGTDLALVPSASPNGCTTSWAGYFCDYLVHEIRNMPELGETPDDRERTLRQGGLTIVATIDQKTQDAAQNAVSDRVSPTDGAIGSLASVEPQTGYIMAMANSRNYGVDGDGVSNINYAVDWNMGGGEGIQNGSSMKPFVLAAAINQGIGLNTTINSPSPMAMGGKKWKTCSGWATAERSWNPKNSTGEGSFNLRTGTEKSINTFYIQLSQRTGLCEPATIAESSGVVRANAGMPDGDGTVPRELEQVPSFSLGVNNVSPLGLAQGYAMFANRGVHCPATAIVSITAPDGTVLADHSKPECTRVLEAKVADAVNSVLVGVIHNPGGTGGRMKLDDGRVAAGKTGTRNDAISVWFAGYVPQLATAVAVADVDAPLDSLDGRTFNGDRIGEACGGCIPGPIWQNMMNGALDGEDKLNFKKPDDSVTRGASAVIPDVRGRSSEDAIAALEGEGFSASIAGEVASNLAAGLVVRTTPAAGDEVSAGSYVGLYVSAGEGGGEWGDEEGDAIGRPPPLGDGDEEDTRPGDDAGGGDDSGWFG